MKLNPNPDRTYMGTKQFAKFVGVSDRHVRNMIADGVLPSLRLGRRVLVPSDALDYLVQEVGA